MNRFGTTGAWLAGFRGIRQHWLAIGLILTGLGVAAPFAAHYALLGGPAGLVNQSIYGTPPTGLFLLDRPMLLLAMAIGYALQTGAMFAALRLSLTGSSIGGALLYGLAAGLLAAALTAALHLVGELAGQALAEPDLAILSVLAFLLPLGLVFTLFFMSQAIMVAAGIALTVAVAMIYGAATGTMGLAATMVGGIGGVAVLFLLLGVFLVWLAARSSCVTPLMAERRSLNLPLAIRDSWRLTMDDQGAITLYLALVGIAMAVLAVGGSILLGAGGNAILRDAGGPDFVLVPTLVRLAAGIPLALLTVALPAGIYRQLTREEISAEVFA